LEEWISEDLQDGILGHVKRFAKM